MTTLDTSLTEMQRGVREALGAYWGLMLAQGAIMVVLGLVAVVWPVTATIAVDIFAGWLFLISGSIGLVAIFSADNVPAFIWSLITAALSVVVGVLLIWRPIEGAVSLTFVLIAFFIAEGVFQIATSIAYRDVVSRSWGWMLVSGITDLVLAAIIIIGMPLSAGWALGLLVGINLVTSGWAIVMTALAGRSVARAIA
jgi:uncharacterized membrane protein HdeD (DUF308 family)